MPKWLNISLKVLAGLVTLLLLFIVGIFLYVTFNKAKVLRLVNDELSKNVDGTVTIGNLHPQFFKGFPDISIGLEDVLARDKRFAEHHHTLLDAKDFSVSINVGALLKGTIAINHIDISNATVDLYTDSNGYSNTSIFKKGPKNKNEQASSGSSSATELKKFSLTNVGFSVNDQKAKKLFSFVVNDIRGKMAYPDSGWHASLHMDVTVKSMAFSTAKGSFIKGKAVEGTLEAGYNQSTGRINVQADALDIGDDPFKLNAVFVTGKGPATFAFHLADDHLQWGNAAKLLSPNIALKLNQFNIDKPIAVTAVISGSFGGGDPYLYVTAKVNNSIVSLPGSAIDNCNFLGVFTNNNVKGKGFTDENSVIRLMHMTGLYKHVPFTIDTGSIVNLVKPVATGNFRANFPAQDLNYLMQDVAKFSNGTADINLRYKADIVDYRVNKPIVSGGINFKNADINSLTSDLHFKNTSLSLNFVKNDLVLSNINIQSGRSVVKMDGRINNFLNLYYDAPEKILLTWNIRSPQLYLGEFLGFLSGGNNSSSAVDPSKAAAGNGNSGDVINQLNNALHKGNAEIHLIADNVHYFKFLATNTRADLVTTSEGLLIKNVSLNTAGGSLNLNGYLKKGNALNRMAVKTTVSNVNVKQFFYAFDNFGLKDFTYENLKGTLSAKANITAGLDNKAAIISKSINGTVDINLKNGALVNFKPLMGVAKYAFPFRDLKNITLANLDGKFTVKGDKIEISPMLVSSSVLNVDVAGTYGLATGAGNATNLAVDIPLRNPKGDDKITDPQELQKARYRGIVIHVLAKADETGKIKIGLNKNHKDTSQ